MILAVAGLVVAPVAALAIAVARAGDTHVVAALTEPFFDNPKLLLVLLVADLVVLAFHAWVILDAWSEAGPPRRAARTGNATARSASVVVVLGLIAAVGVPHGWALRRDLALYDLLTFDFSVDRSASGDPPAVPQTTAPHPASTEAPATTAPATTAPATSETTGPPPTAPTTDPPGTTATSLPTSTTTTSAPATSTTTPATSATDWVTIALLGGDSGPGRTGVRTDTIVVVAIDPRVGRAAMFSVPRNWQNAPFPEGHPAAEPGCGCYPEIVNSLYQYALDHPDLFPDGPNPGGTAIRTVLGELLGIEIDYYALIDLQGFEAAVDVLGGIDINVLVGVEDPGHVHPDLSVSDVVIYPGSQHMDGRTALAYARARRQTDDYNRMGRQRCVLEAIVEQADPVTVLQALPDLVDVLTGSLVTDVPTQEWPDLIRLLDTLDTAATVSVQFVPAAPELAGTGTTYVGNVGLVRATVRNALELPLDQALATIGVPSLDDACG
jgi:LCP family protein required for cell wall assembly